ncbi:LAFA_0B01134g1_1 [Lachancea sp. 'fantastica']|nr:LAFA_0B01134g1_1 [Lachancea sp. 'fantastica']
MTSTATVAQVAAQFALGRFETHVSDSRTIVNGTRKPLIVYISGPQGSGKTFSSEGVKQILHETRPELKSIVVSIDDFYLTHSDQQTLAKRYPENAMLQGRGLPGTHDMQLLKTFMSRLYDNTGLTRIPAYDKSRFAGEGDRIESSKEVQLPVDIVIMEGWFLGFESLSQEKLTCMCNKASNQIGNVLSVHPLDHYTVINAYLKSYADLLWDDAKQFSVGVVIAADVENVYAWRQEQETALIAKTGHGMSQEQVRAFILRYMPCYELYYPTLKTKGKLGNSGTFVVSINKQRAVINVEQRQTD